MAPISTGRSNRDVTDDSEIDKAAEKVIADTKTMIERFLGDISKASAAQQLLIGTASGWCTGMVAAKVGKMAALALGGGIIAMQVAHQQGYVQINWDKLTRKVDKIVDKIDDKKPGLVEKVGEYARRNTCVAAGFVGGFFIGISFA